MVGKKNASGRISTKGFHTVEVKHMRTAYTIQFKKNVLDFYDVNGASQTVTKFWPDLKSSSPAREAKRQLIYQWRKNKDRITKLGNMNRVKKLKKIRPLGTSSSLSSEVEDELIFWVRTLRQNGVPVTDSILRTKARLSCRQTDVNNFLASTGWLKTFKKKYGLSLRAKSHQGQTSIVLPNPVATQFALDVRQKMIELNVDCVWNADQTAVNYETIPGKTLDKIGSKTIFIRTAGKEKERISVLLLGSSNGQKKPPFVIFKGKQSVVEASSLQNRINQHGFGSCVWKKIQEINKTSTTQIYCNQNGWFTSDMMVIWLYHNFSDNVEKPKILLLDDFTAHWTSDVLAAANILNITLMKIPSGFTSVCQPANVSWNKPFKSHLRTMWSEKLRTDMEANEGIFKAKVPQRDVLIDWVDSAWEQLSHATMISGFSKPGYIDRHEGIDEPLGQGIQDSNLVGNSSLYLPDQYFE